MQELEFVFLIFFGDILRASKVLQNDGVNFKIFKSV